MRNNKTRSGNHQKFEDYVGKKTWLLYLNEMLIKLGDTNLMECCYHTIPDDIKLTSDSMSSNISSIDRNIKKRKNLNTSDSQKVESIMKQKIMTMKTKNLEMLEERATVQNTTLISDRFYFVTDQICLINQSQISIKNEMTNIKNELRNKDELELKYSS